MDKHPLEEHKVTYSFEKHIRKTDEGYLFINSMDYGPFHKFESCYKVHEELLKNNVVSKDTDHDHEFSCCYYTFKHKAEALKFIKKLNKYAQEHSE